VSWIHLHMYRFLNFLLFYKVFFQRSGNECVTGYLIKVLHKQFEDHNMIFKCLQLYLETKYA
jgi:hypothetical protein